MRTPRIRAAALAAALPLVLAPYAASADPRGPENGGGQEKDFDLQAHRGGIALTVENTLPAFANALELGVSTLELDVQVTEDGHAVVTHDRDPSPRNCRDTAPAFADDPEFPYVPNRTYIKDLTLAQVRTIDCGSLRHPLYPDQELSPGEPMPLLSQVFDLVNAHHAEHVTLNVETKVEAGAPEQTAPREAFVRAVLADIRDARIRNQVTIQSFDWGALMRVRELEPRLPIVALTNGQQFLQAGRDGASPWLGGIDIDAFPGNLQEKYVAATASFDADAVSPVHGDPQGGTIDTPGYVPFTTQALVDAAHQAGMRVIPWTVNDRATMEHLIGLGIDGLITDRPDLLREVMADEGLALPRSYPARR
ncbi:MULTISPECIES: glycerophosphodiester phosphodiesterase family protein [Nocardioides]|uniref:Glycerophosphodiester phosphodiesterase family protein n=1 Tax=Nocardioides vastitatis TaxID=2568655 RepID=A0ABW0ZLJ7_9ACTN|nr:glycerophosphodiester phosphodiesterase family protein [Nocardioides sp.]THI97253.1 glycerophosphodiester phosphodiesterase [Nocardioides sp.]